MSRFLGWIVEAIYENDRAVSLILATLLMGSVLVLVATLWSAIT